MKHDLQQAIISYVQTHSSVSVTELSQALTIPRTSLLRYLRELTTKNLISKSFGEVRALDQALPSFESPAQGRLGLDRAVKSALARAAAELVNEGEVIFLDGGSTTYALAAQLRQKRISLFTNNLLITRLIDANYLPRVHVLPGLINARTLVSASAATIEALSKLSFDKAFLGFNSLVKNELATTNEAEQVVKSLALRRATQTYFLGNAAKSAKAAPYVFAELSSGVLVKVASNHATGEHHA